MKRLPILACLFAIPLHPFAAASSQCFEFTLRGISGQNFFAATSNPAVIAHVQAQLQLPLSKRTQLIDGPIDTGNGGINGKWNWHFIPDKWDMADAATEVCDGTPDYVAAHRDDWIAHVKYYCPWASEVLRPCQSAALGSAAPGLGGAWMRAEGAGGFARTRVTYMLPRVAAAAIEVRRLDGSLFATLACESQAAGEHALDWNGGSGVFRLVLKLDGRAAASASVVRP